MNTEVERIWEEALLTKFEVLSWQFPGKTQEKP
jgi:hypothetical protein